MQLISKLDLHLTFNHLQFLYKVMAQQSQGLSSKVSDANF
jgi:hypothetical protein